MPDSVLQLLEDERIFSIEKKDNGDFILTEKCDYYFKATLTPAQLMQLTVELRQMLND